MVKSTFFKNKRGGKHSKTDMNNTIDGKKVHPKITIMKLVLIVDRWSGWFKAPSLVSASILRFASRSQTSRHSLNEAIFNIE